MNNYKFDFPLPKSMPKTEREQLVMILKRLKEHAELTNANFGHAMIHISGERTITEYVKETTRLYRASWLIHPIQELIDRYELSDTRKEMNKS